MVYYPENKSVISIDFCLIYQILQNVFTKKNIYLIRITISVSLNQYQIVVLDYYPNRQRRDCHVDRKINL